MEYCWLFRFSACGRTTKSAGFWASDSEYEQGPAGEQKTSEFTLSTKVAVEYEYLGREAYLKNPRSVRFRLTKAEITLYLYRSVRNYKLEIKWQKQNYKPAKQSGR